MSSNISDGLYNLLQPQRLTSVVDVGANPIDSEPPYKRMLGQGLCTVIGFEPQASALDLLNQKKGPHETYLPTAVGDGTERTLQVFHINGMTSLLEPDPEHLALFNEFPGFGEVAYRMPMLTTRLDDIAQIEALDFLKIDIQGAELDVFASGKQKLSRAVAIQTEVSFITLYKDQPSLGMVDTALRELGFVPHCIAELKKWPISPILVDGHPRMGLNQILEADLVYVRDFSRLENMDGEQWKHLALIAHHCYESYDLALRAVISAAQLGAVPADAPDRYIGLFEGQTGPSIGMLRS